MTQISKKGIKKANPKFLTFIPCNDSVYKAEVYDKIEHIAQCWDEIAGDEILLRSEYLKIYEDSPSPCIRPNYLLISDDEQPIGIYLLHFHKVNLGTLFLNTLVEDKQMSIFQQFKFFGLNLINFEYLIIGNPLMTGPYYGRHKQQLEGAKIEVAILSKLIASIEQLKEPSGLSMPAVLIKDFNEQILEGQPSEYGLHPFKVEPNMVLEIRSDWRILDDYLSSLKAKVRTKFHKHLSVGRVLEKRQLNIEDLYHFKSDVYRLYLDVVEGSKFYLGKISKDYFYEFKKRFPHRFFVVGYFYQDKLVGFYSYLLDQTDSMHAHFVGYDKQQNHELRIYNNFLLDFIEIAITLGKKRLEFFRTALEIKSSYGAIPEDLILLLKMRCPIANKTIPALLKKFIPKNEWTPRNPFKTQ